MRMIKNKPILLFSYWVVIYILFMCVCRTKSTLSNKGSSYGPNTWWNWGCSLWWNELNERPLWTEMFYKFLQLESDGKTLEFSKMASCCLLCLRHLCCLWKLKSWWIWCDKYCKTEEKSSTPTVWNVVGAERTSRHQLHNVLWFMDLTDNCTAVAVRLRGVLFEFWVGQASPAPPESLCSKAWDQIQITPREVVPIKLSKGIFLCEVNRF
jgi:hypothetical protein